MLYSTQVKVKKSATKPDSDPPELKFSTPALGGYLDNCSICSQKWHFSFWTLPQNQAECHSAEEAHSSEHLLLTTLSKHSVTLLPALSHLKHGVEPESTAFTHAHADMRLSHKPSNLRSGHGLGIHRCSHSNPHDIRASV